MKRPKLKYEVEYMTMPYGAKSLMRKKEREFAINKKDAMKWAKIISKNGNNYNIEIHKLKKVI
jgi:hypothetical protein